MNINHKGIYSIIMLYVVYMANLTSCLNNNFNVGQNFCDKFEN